MGGVRWMGLCRWRLCRGRDVSYLELFCQLLECGDVGVAARGLGVDEVGQAVEWTGRTQVSKGKRAMGAVQQSTRSGRLQSGQA